MGGLFPIYKETGSGVMFVYALGAMRAVCVVCVGGGVEAGGGVWSWFLDWGLDSVWTRVKLHRLGYLMIIFNYLLNIFSFWAYSHM